MANHWASSATLVHDVYTRRHLAGHIHSMINAFNKVRDVYINKEVLHLAVFGRSHKRLGTGVSVPAILLPISEVKKGLGKVICGFAFHSLFLQSHY